MRHPPSGPFTRIVVLALGWIVASSVPPTGPRALSAQTSPYVLISDPAYRDLDVLVAHRLVQDLVLSHRPYSRMTFARAVAGARGRLRDEVPARILEALERLERRFAEELGGRVCEEDSGRACGDAPPRVRVRSLRGGLTRADSPTREAREPSRNAGNAAQINPLLQRNGGRELFDGWTVDGEAEVDIDLHPRLALQFTPRIRVSEGAPEEVDAAGIQLVTGYARTVWRKAFIDVGRAQTLSGVTPDLSPVLSTNPRALTMVRVGNERPGRLPWIFGLLGPSSFRFSVGSLGDSRVNPGSWLTVFDAAFRPHPNFEIGASIVSEQGGDGVPEVPWWQRAFDTFLFPFYRNPIRILEDPVRGASNKTAGLHSRLHLPGTPLTAFFEFTTEDDHFLFRRTTYGYWENAAWVWGLEARGLGEGGRIDLRVAAMHNGVIVASHNSLRGGMTVDGRTLGSPLGPEGTGVDARLDWTGSRDRWSIHGALERYSGDDYGGEPRFQRERVADNPDEIRARLTVDWLRGGLQDGLFTTVRVGAERVNRFGFTDENRVNLLAQVALGYRW